MLSSITDTVHRHFDADADSGLSNPGARPDLGRSLLDALTIVPDPRASRGVRYPFRNLLHIIVCAVIAGANTLTTITEWAQDMVIQLGYPAGTPIPSLATFHRVIKHVDAQLLDTVFNEWVHDRMLTQTSQDGARRAVAVDGKEVRGAKNGGQSRVFLFAALDHGTGAVIGQESIGEKTNEIPHFAPLMDRISDLAGMVITADALHTQKAHAEYVHERGAFYVFTVKGNQRALYNKIASQTWASLPVQHTVCEKGHGRTTTWSITCQPAQDWIGFPHAKQTIRLTRDRHDHATGEKTREHVFAITSLPTDQASPQDVGRYVRGHWGIENRLHWVRDVSFNEDKSQIRAGNGAHVMATIRNLAISVHRLAGATNIAKALRAANRDPRIIHQLIS